MVKGPCLKCPERRETCWNECERYLEYKRQKELEKEALAAFKQEHNTRRGERVFARVKGQL